MKKLILSIFNWIFAAELNQLKQQISKAEKNNFLIEKVLKNIDVSVDVHEYSSNSWAVVSIQGRQVDYLKFIDLGECDARAVQNFLRDFEKSHRIKIDASPRTSQFLKVKRY